MGHGGDAWRVISRKDSWMALHTYCGNAPKARSPQYKFDITCKLSWVRMKRGTLGLPLYVSPFYSEIDIDVVVVGRGAIICRSHLW